MQQVMLSSLFCKMLYFMIFVMFFTFKGSNLKKTQSFFHKTSLCSDRPCLEDRNKVQRVQRSVESGLTHILHRDNQESLIHKVNISHLGVQTLKGLYAPCFISVSTRKIAGFPRCCRKLTAKCVCPPCSCTRRWGCCARCAVCTWRSFTGLVSGTRSQLTLCFLRSTRSCSHQRQSFCRGPLTDDLREYAKTVAHQRTETPISLSLITFWQILFF